MSVTGRVKWFNNKSGFGFITVCDGPHKDKDIFAHFSALKGESSQYKYLVQGEYVDFTLAKCETGKHEFNAADVTGVKGGLLMCDTHRLNASQGPPRPVSSGTGVGGGGDIKRKPRVVDRR
jgi:CspA family cold shock protein